MNKFIILLILQLFSMKLFCQAVWFEQNSKVNSDLNSIYFINENTGFAVGSLGVLIYTTNAGINWQKTKFDSTFHFEKIIFTDAKVGYIIGGSGNWSNSLLLKTSDVGKNWIELNSIEIAWPLQELDKFSNSLGKVTWPINDIYFVNSNTGFVVSFNTNPYRTNKNSQIIFKTTDGALNWTPQNCVSNWLYSIFFLNEQLGYAAGNFGILATMNGGESWFTINNEVQGLRSIVFVNSNTGYAVGHAGLILKSENGGHTWIDISYSFYNYKKILFINSNVGYIVGTSGTILKTTNDGNSWIRLNSGVDVDLYSIFFVNQQTGYVVGESGKILKTTCSGE